MNDKDLYELCVSSGFSESQWWPSLNSSVVDFALRYDTEELSWYWHSSLLDDEGDREDEMTPNAHARILAGLVEWGVSNDKWINLENDMSQVRSFGGDDETQPYHKGEPIVALLNCFRQWKVGKCL